MAIFMTNSPWKAFKDEILIVATITGVFFGAIMGIKIYDNVKKEKEEKKKSRVR